VARLHGKDARVYLGGRDISGDIVSVDLSPSAETHDVTTFASSGWRAFDPGLGAWEASFSGFYQTNAGATSTTIGRQLEDILGVNTTGASVLSIWLDSADAVGDSGFLASDAVASKIGEAIAIGDLIKSTATLKGTGRAALDARLLHPLATDSTSANGTSYDNAASSSNGGRANLHITAATGTGGVVKVQHSTNNSTWVDLVTFTTAAAIGCQTGTVTGTVNRYVRSISTINSSSSLTYVAGFARY